MVDFSQQCRKYFNTANIYDVFDIPINANPTEVRKAYYRLSLQIHPDRVSEELKSIATEKFKIINMIHCVLSDAEKKKIYDTTGLLDIGDIDFDSSEASKNYWKNCFRTVDVESIRKYEFGYKESLEEIEDLKNAYLKYKGDMNFILETVLFGHPNEEPRYCKILHNLIKRGDVPSYRRFVEEPESEKLKRKRKYEREAKAREEAERRKRKEASGSRCGVSGTRFTTGIGGSRISRGIGGPGFSGGICGPGFSVKMDGPRFTDGMEGSEDFKGIRGRSRTNGGMGGSGATKGIGRTRANRGFGTGEDAFPGDSSTGTESLADLIGRRHAERSQEFFKHLEEKYGDKTKDKKK